MLLGFILVAVTLWGLSKVIRNARTGATAGPRTPAMRSRAARPRPPSARHGRTAMRAAGALAIHPASRTLRAQAKADAYTAWQGVYSTDWLERQRHAREHPETQAPAAVNGTVIGSDGATAGPGRRWVPEHEPDPQGRVRRAAAAVIPGAVFGKLPPRVQGALCGCPICKGTQPHQGPWATPPPGPDGSSPPAATANGATGPAATPALTASPPPSRQATPTPAPNGGPPMAGASSASAEKMIEGITEIHQHAFSGGIHAKREALAAINEAASRMAAMVQMMARQMAEPGQNYGPEITEPLAKAGQHFNVGGMAVTESDNAIQTLLNMTVGDLSRSSRQAPHHRELSENGAR